MKDPKRLLADDDMATLAPELFEGLRAMQREAPDAAVVARTLRALDALPAQAPPAWPARTITWLSIGAVITAGGLTFFLLREPNSPAAKPVVHAAVPSVAPRLEAPAAQPEPAPEVVPEPELPPPPFAAQPRASSAKRAAPTTFANPTRRAAPPPAAAKPESSAPQPPATSAPAPAAATHAAGPAAPRLPEVTSKLQSPEPTDEAGLLFRAKRLAKREPEAALRLLESHAFYFPNGAFVQEREVLAIRLLERVGRSAQAAERATKFRARFPGSVYRSSETP